MSRINYFLSYTVANVGYIYNHRPTILCVNLSTFGDCESKSYFFLSNKCLFCKVYNYLSTDPSSAPFSVRGNTLCSFNPQKTFGFNLVHTFISFLDVFRQHSSPQLSFNIRSTYTHTSLKTSDMTTNGDFHERFKRLTKLSMVYP